MFLKMVERVKSKASMLSTKVINNSAASIRTNHSFLSSSNSLLRALAVDLKGATSILTKCSSSSSLGAAQLKEAMPSAMMFKPQ
jgi:hypothetical protein